MYVKISTKIFKEKGVNSCVKIQEKL